VGRDWENCIWKPSLYWALLGGGVPNKKEEVNGNLARGRDVKELSGEEKKNGKQHDDLLERKRGSQ